MLTLERKIDPYLIYPGICTEHGMRGYPFIESERFYCFEYICCDKDSKVKNEKTEYMFDMKQSPFFVGKFATHSKIQSGHSNNVS